MKVAMFVAFVICIGACLIVGCGGDDGGSDPSPVTGVEITPAKAALEIGHSTEITATVSGGSDKSLTWFVNDVENGDETYGTITENSAVTYTAPDSLPSPRTVVIGAVSVEDTSKVDTCRIRVEFTRLFVDSAAGNDDTANGCINLPYRTITRALPQATSGMTVLVRPGTYSNAAGEFFTMHIYDGISLVGEDWETCIIRNDTQSGGYGIMLSGDDAALRKITISQAEDARWRFPLLTRENDGLVDSVRMFERGTTSCFRIEGAENTTVQNCVFNVEQDITDKVSGRGIELVFDDQDVIIRNCRVSGFGVALFFNHSSNALVEGCYMINNYNGVELCCLDDEDSNPVPDFGGGARGSTGGNNIWGNSYCGLANFGTSTIYAKFNTWDNDPPVAGEDYCNEGAGSIIVE